MELQKLKPDVISKIQSTCTITNVAQCVQELVLNSLDAKSKAIAIRVNLITFRIQVVDNGLGIGKDNMKAAGIRYMTNKCTGVKDLQKHYKFYGVRGESLASIFDLSKTAQLTSKCDGLAETYTKCITNNVHSSVIQCSNRPSYGTTITIEGLFHNLAVRKKAAKPELEMEDIKTTIEHLIIFHPNVSFTLRNDINGNLILNSFKQQDVVHAFLGVHPSVSDNFLLIKIKKENVIAQGMIHKETYKNNKLQYVYVNRRPVFNSDIQKYTCRLLRKNEKTKTTCRSYPIFILNIKCVYVDVNILFNSNKTLVDFNNWNVVKKCIDKLVGVYTGNDNSKAHVIQKKQCNYIQRCSVSNMEGVVKGKAFKRKMYGDIQQKNETEFEETQSVISTDKLQKYPVAEKHKYSNKDNQIIPSSFKQKSQMKKTKKCEYKTIKEKKLFLNTLMHESGILKNKSSHKYLKHKSKNNEELRIKSRSKTPFKFNLLSNDTENNYSIYFSDKDQQLNEKKTLGTTFRKPLPIMINPIKLPEEIITEPHVHNKKLNNISFYSRFTDNENTGKSLIMDMFLKSTQVYPNDAQYMSVSEESLNTVLESNLLLENKTKTDFHEVNTTMSISVKVKKRKFCDNKGTRKSRSSNERNFNMISQGIQTSFPTMDQKGMVSECVQTTLDFNQRQSNYINNNTLKTANEDDYTINLPQMEGESYNCEFPENNSEYNNLFGGSSQNYIACQCKDPKIMFNFGERKKKHKKNVLEKIDVSPIPLYIEKKDNLSLMNVTKTVTYISQDSLEFTDHDRNNLWQQFITSKCTITPRKNVPINMMQQYSPYFQRKQTPYAKMSLVHFQKMFKSEELPQNKHEQGHLPKQKSDPEYTFQMHSFKSFNPPFFSTQNQNFCQAFQDNLSTNTDRIFLYDTVNKFTNEEEIADMFKEDEIENGKAFLNQFCNQDIQGDGQVKPEEQYNQEIWSKLYDSFGAVQFVNKRTGFVRSQTPKTETNIFELKQRPDYLPKGLSPLLKKNVEVETSMAETSKEKLHTALIENCDELKLLKWENYIVQKDPNKFFEMLYQEKTKLFENDVPSATKLSKYLKPVHVKVFQKDIFKRLKTIGQVDKKFIATMDAKERLIIIFDQHAVHERISLEQLQKDYKDVKVGCTQITLFVRQVDLQLLKQNEHYLNSIGLTVTFFTNTVNIKEIPLSLHKKIMNETDKNALSKYIEMLIQEIIDLLKQTKGATVIIPTLIQNIISMEACRGAIKFGDPLSRNTCADLISELSSCDLPFQCAHGRPTLTPLVHWNCIINKVNIGFSNEYKDMPFVLDQED